MFQMNCQTDALIYLMSYISNKTQGLTDSRLLLLSETFKIFETKKANYQMLWLAFFAFDQDKINLSELIHG